MKQQQAKRIGRCPGESVRIPLNIIAKPSGAACNLDCKYCFFLSKELLYNQSGQKMSLDTLETYLKSYLDASPDGPVNLIWQGGEPTLRGLPFFEKAVALAQAYRRPNQEIVQIIQTNGTLIDEKWAKFLAENHFLVGISLDGPAELHDKYRVNKANRATHQQVVRGWEYLQAAGVECNILCTVHQGNQDCPLEVYRYFRDQLGAKYLQFIPIVERVTPQEVQAAEDGWRLADGTRILYLQTGQGVTSRSVKPEKYGEFLTKIFDEWVKKDVGEIFVQDFDSALSNLFDLPSVCVHAPSCGLNLAIEFNGDVYTCDHWVEPDWKIGSIKHQSFRQMVAGETMREFAKKKFQQLSPLCQHCPFLRVCWGGCPKDRFVKIPDTEIEHNFLCPGYKILYSHIMPDIRRMAGLVRQGKPASAIMEQNK